MSAWIHTQTLTAYELNAGTKLLGAIAFWITGGIVINFLITFVTEDITSRKVDPRLLKYDDSCIRVLLRIVMVLAVLSVFDIKTAGFAALLAASGIVKGVVWSGLLANFAAGVSCYYCVCSKRAT